MTQALSNSRESGYNGALGKVLGGIRTELGLNQERFGQLLGLSQNSVSMIESGKRPVQVAEIMLWTERIAETHPLSVAELRERFFNNPFVERWADNALTSDPEDLAKGG